MINADCSLSVNNIRRLVARIKSSFWGNERCIELMAACAIAGEPLLILGDPGTGKTSMATIFFEGIGLSRNVKDGYFEKCLHPYMDPSEMYGPLDFQKLIGGQHSGASEYVRQVEGYLPSARAAFLDEIFAAKPDFLLTMLSMLEERKYHNGSRIVVSPLSIIVAASNELPQDDQLKALRDRLPIRVVTDVLKTTADRKEALERSVENWIRHEDAAHISPPCCTYQDIAVCSGAILPRGDDFLGGQFLADYVSCLDAIAKHPDDLSAISPRAQHKAYKVMRALALLRRGTPEPSRCELRVLEHLFRVPDPAIRTAISDELDRWCGKWELLYSAG